MAWRFDWKLERAGLADAAGVDASKVSIVSIEEVALRRRSGMRKILATALQVGWEGARAASTC
jgi:hypothetical protein